MATPSHAIATTDTASIVESVIVKGDLAKLSPEERTRYYSEVCRSVGLNPLTKPFEYLQLNGKLTLYARKDATDQLRQLHNVSLTIVSREQVGDVYVVTARATTGAGRSDESIGAVSIGSLKGDALANALMKCETKAKRRVTLSICGLGLLDETEVETIPDAQIVPATVGQSGFTQKQLQSAINSVGAALGETPVAMASSEQVEALTIIGEELQDYKVGPDKFLLAINNLAKTRLADLSVESLNTLTSDQVEMLIDRLGKRLDDYQKDAVKASKKVPADDYQVDASGYAVDDFDTDGPQF